MIYLYSGTPGSGKSLHTASVIYHTLKRGLPVIANFPINLERIKGRKGEFVEKDNSSLNPQFLIDYTKEFFKGKPIKEGKLLLIIDECQLMFNARDYDLLSDKVSKWLNNLRSRYAPDLKYLLVPELHKDGVHYHFHALIANTGNIQFIDSGIKHNDNIIYNIGNWKFGFTTASKVIDSARASSYITKYITKDLCSVTKFKKRYWSSRNCDRPKVRTYCLPYEEIGKFLDDNIHLLQYTKEVVIDSCGLAVTYIEMKKE